MAEQVVDRAVCVDCVGQLLVALRGLGPERGHLEPNAGEACTNLIVTKSKMAGKAERFREAAG